MTFLPKYSMIYRVAERAQGKEQESEKDGSIAQLGEHLPYKQGVTGSSPVGPIYMAK